MPIEKNNDQRKTHGGGENAVCTADVEVSQADRGGARMFFDQQSRNEITGNDEKDTHTQIGAKEEESR
jgi:hypothetical protein